MSKLKTPICSRLGIEWPIFGFAHSVDVVSAVSAHGGLGVFGGTRNTPEEITDAMTQARRGAGEAPIGLDLVLPKGMPQTANRQAIEAEIPQAHREFVDGLWKKYQVPAPSKPGMRSRFVRSEEIAAAQVEAALATDVNVFACGIGAPKEVVARAKALGKTTLALVGSQRHAQAALAVGVDLLVAQGTDAGAHTGPIGTFSLVPQVVDVAGDVPVIAAGGVATGRHIAAALALGAQGVWMGTAWLTSHEHAAKLSPTLVNKLLAARSEDTVISRSDSGKTMRMLRSAWSEEWAAPEAPEPLTMPYHDILTGDLQSAINEHEIEPLVHGDGCGQSIAYFNEARPVRDIMEQLLEETEQTLARITA